MALNHYNDSIRRDILQAWRVVTAVSKEHEVNKAKAQRFNYYRQLRPVWHVWIDRLMMVYRNRDWGLQSEQVYQQNLTKSIYFTWRVS
jgi:hypothetical protein